MPKLESEKDKSLTKTCYFQKPEETQPNVFGNEDDFSLTCERDSETADINCRYVFGVKSSTSDEYCRFVEPNSNGDFLQLSKAKVFSTKEFSGADILFAVA